MSRSSSGIQSGRHDASVPAGGMASPPTEPPPASGLSSPLRGQQETTCPLPPSGGGEKAKDDMYATAFEFGWQSYLQHGRVAASEPLPFESVEPELEKRWRELKQERMPWQAAREVARDAWNRVQDAITDGSQAKSSAR